jgi:hypothetical protein
MSEFTFHPHLFETRSEVQELLAAEGLHWLSDYSAIDVLHDVHGLEVLGLPDRGTAERVLRLLRGILPGWGHGHVTVRERVSRDPGWKVVVHRDLEEDRGGQPTGQ